MENEKIDFLKTYLSLYIGHQEIVEHLDDPDSPYVVLDIRNAPAAIKKDQIKGARAIAAKDLTAQLATLPKDKTYVVYDWTAGTTLGKTALLILLSNGYQAFELASALEGWKGMHLPIEPVAAD
ncbi:rhodanese-like domain-containing protein [Furfurilactobacillus curtus]|uniref:Sulfurtransferase n=1 Tax=Furfurilactobacillus curtus TaxID=1746200 RepID=A0ABQ5JPG9_9LACO